MKRLFLLRRFFHLSGIFIPVIYSLTNRRFALFAALAAALVIGFLEVLRIKGRIRVGFVNDVLKEREMRGPTGALFYLASFVATILFFEKRVALASMFILAISDPLSSIVGLRWGKRFLNGKSAEGTTAFFFSSLLILIAFSFRWPALLPVAAAATAAEFFSSRYVDDNLTIPIVTALALTLFGN